MRLLILGATGATGRELVTQALARGHYVTAFARDPARITMTHASLRAMQGDVGRFEQVSEAIKGQDAVISALGVSKPLNKDPVVVEGIRHVIGAMQAHAVRRLIYQSFIGVHESRAAAGFILGNVAPIPLRHEIADHEIKESLVRASDLDWTIVRPPKLTNGPFTGRVRDGEDIVSRAFLATLSRADIADFILRQVSDASYIRKSPRVLR